MESYSVKEINLYVKKILEGDFNLNDIWIRGEISNFKNAASGHLYFTLSDQGGSISVAIFKSYAKNISVEVKNGDSVFIKGRVSIYEVSGNYQFYGSSILKDGIGDILLKIEEVKTKLLNEGLFKLEKPLIPENIEAVGVITSSKGAVIHDIQEVLRKRNPFIRIILYPSNVQGKEAVSDLIKGIDVFNRYGKVDVIILGRGGGSFEDLLAFNDEMLVRKVIESKIPIVTAVGHETDVTLVDYASSLKSATPSEGALLISRDEFKEIRDIKRKLQSDFKIFENKMINLDLKISETRDLLHKYLNLKNIKRREIFKLLRDIRLKTDNNIKNKEREINYFLEKFTYLNPLNLLKKGYSIVEEKKKIVRYQEIEINQMISILMDRGKLNCKVIGKENTLKNEK